MTMKEKFKIHDTLDTASILLNELAMKTDDEKEKELLLRMSIDLDVMMHKLVY